MRQGRYAAGVASVFMATIGWSLSGLFVRLLPELDGWQINCWRGLFMALSLLLYLTISHGRETLERFDDMPFFGFMACAVCFAVGTTFYVSSLKFASTATVSVIGATSPLITALLSPWLTGERPHKLAWLAAFLAIGGMGVIAWNGMVRDSMFGVLLSLGVPLTFALQTLMLRRFREVDTMTAICVGGFLAFLLAIIGSEVLGEASVFAVSGRSLAVLAVMGVVQLATPLVLYGWGAKSVPAVSLALISMLDAVFNPLWSFLFVGEKPEVTSVIGGGIILGAVLLSILGMRYYASAVVTPLADEVPEPI